MTETATERIARELGEQFPPEVDRMDRAAARFEAQHAGLLRPDGTKKYGDAEHQERVNALLGDFNGVGAEVEQAAEEAIVKAKADIARLDGGDPIDSLKGDDLARASSLRAFIAE